ncbi:hypothetical protein DFQ26_000318 [Actinomortierella ambigua]|nr:hypothetical protein DFQ26_000318 [Actinomortierella ambigua]
MSIAGRRMAQSMATPLASSCRHGFRYQRIAVPALGRHQAALRQPVALQVAGMTRLFHTTPLRWTSQTVSTTTTTRTDAKGTNSQDAAAVAAAAAAEEPIQGTASLYHRHLLICKGVPSKEWPKKPELSDPYLNLLTTAVRGQIIKVNLTDVATTVVDGSSTLPSLSSVSKSREQSPRHDVVLFPDNVKFCQLGTESFRDLDRFLAAHPVSTLRPFLEARRQDSDHQGQHQSLPSSSDGRTTTVELVAGVPESKVEIELVPERSAILVCTHGARDCRCGDRGGEMQRILKDMVEQTGLSSAVKVYGVSHIGGHKHAPNTIIYPSGDWHGDLSEHDSVDAQQILFAALSTASMTPEALKTLEPVMLDKWRGRIGMSQDQQLKYYQEIQERHEKFAEEYEQESASSSQSLFAAPGEDLYQDDGLPMNIDCELKHTEQKEELLKARDKAASATAPEDTDAAASSTVNIVFETFQKVKTPIKAKIGERILDIVKDKDDPSRHNVYQALECTCGGQLECATCHVYIESPYYERLPPVTDAEEDMLEYAIGRKAHSRLGCQIRMKPEYEGMVVKLPQY